MRFKAAVGAWGAMGALLLASGSASALEPLSDFVREAHRRNFDAREQAAVVAQRRDETSQAWWRLAPTITSSAAYTNNQYEAVVTIPLDQKGDVRTATITPQNQYDFTFTASVPVIDVGAWERIAAAKRTEGAALEQARSTAFDVERNVAQAYYQVVAAEAVLESAHKRRDTAKANLDYIKTRHDAGVASDLDLKRAASEFERTNQDIADADYQVKSTRRTLATVTGVEPSPGGVPLDADTRPEPPLAELEPDASALPSVRAAVENARAADKNTEVTRAGLYPTVSATATERITNATGFGQSPYYLFGATATWRWDLSVIPGTDAAARAADAAHVRAERARRQAQDTAYNAYQAVVQQIEKTRAASAEQDTSDLAVKLAHQRYEAGTANYLDVLTAERDDFAAHVSLIQAAADLAYARVSLRIATGHSIEDGRGGVR